MKTAEIENLYFCECTSSNALIILPIALNLMSEKAIFKQEKEVIEYKVEKAIKN